MTAEVNFVRQQGFGDASPESCTGRYPALMWQPRVIAILVLIGLALQAWMLFLALGVMLWWNAIAPRLNPFDALYNRLVAGPKGLPRLSAAAAPRRFAQAMAGAFMLGIGLSLFLGASVVAWILEALLVAALGALVLGRFCLGSYLFFLCTGRAGFANKTLPWSG